MNQARPAVIVQYLRKLAAVGHADPTSDRELLQRFAYREDEAAFTTLVQRHGPMVLRICQRLLGNWHDAEDVCQAVFLVLAAKAASRFWQESIANWLYPVAYHLALKTKASAAARRARESRAILQPQTDPAEDLSARELQAALHEELARLPEKYRAPLVLCYLEGAKRDEPARQLGCPVGTLKSRVERGWDLLHSRLSRRGLTLSATLSTTRLTEKAAEAALRAGLTAGIVRAAVAHAAQGLACRRS